MLGHLSVVGDAGTEAVLHKVTRWVNRQRQNLGSALPSSSSLGPVMRLAISPETGGLFDALPLPLPAVPMLTPTHKRCNKAREGPLEGKGGSLPRGRSSKLGLPSPGVRPSFAFSQVYKLGLITFLLCHWDNWPSVLFSQPEVAFQCLLCKL